MRSEEFVHAFAEKSSSSYHQQKIISEALRDLLEAFRLPGESQQIDRITETFSQIYVDANPGTSNRVNYHSRGAS